MDVLNVEDLGNYSNIYGNTPIDNEIDKKIVWNLLKTTNENNINPKTYDKIQNLKHQCNNLRKKMNHFYKRKNVIIRKRKSNIHSSKSIDDNSKINIDLVEIPLKFKKFYPNIYLNDIKRRNNTLLQKYTVNCPIKDDRENNLIDRYVNPTVKDEDFYTQRFI